MIEEKVINRPGMTFVCEIKPLTPDQELVQEVLKKYKGKGEQELVMNLINWHNLNNKRCHADYFWEYCQENEEMFYGFSSEGALVTTGLLTGYCVNKYVDDMEQEFALDLSFGEWADSFFDNKRMSSCSNTNRLRDLMDQVLRTKVNENFYYIADLLVERSLLQTSDLNEMYYVGLNLGYLIADRIKRIKLERLLNHEHKPISWGMSS